MMTMVVARVKLKSRRSVLRAVASLAVVTLALQLTFSTSYMGKHEEYDVMLRAARKMLETRR